MTRVDPHVTGRLGPGVPISWGAQNFMTPGNTMTTGCMSLSLIGLQLFDIEFCVVRFNSLIKEEWRTVLEFQVVTSPSSYSVLYLKLFEVANHGRCSYISLFF